MSPSPDLILPEEPPEPWRIIDRQRWIECVLNLSEGRDSKLLSQIGAVVQAVPGVWLLGCSSDRDHNRSVVTFVSQSFDIVEAAHQVVLKVAEQVDLRVHQGVHPRVGAVDVIPFVALGRMPLEIAAQAARELGSRLGNVPGLPVFLYEDSASAEHRRDLAEIRRGGLEGLAERMKSPGWEPDFGPRTLHPQLGAVVVGARRILIAYNIFLDSNDVNLARQIALRIRARNGGLPGVKALGLYLAARDQVQVSMNLTDYRRTGMRQVFERVSELASRLGAEATSSEVIGYVPARALPHEDRTILKLENKETVILEQRILEVVGPAAGDEV